MKQYILYKLVNGVWIEKEIIKASGRKFAIRELKKYKNENLDVDGTWKLRLLR